MEDASWSAGDQARVSGRANKLTGFSFFCLNCVGVRSHPASFPSSPRLAHPSRRSRCASLIVVEPVAACTPVLILSLPPEKRHNAHRQLPPPTFSPVLTLRYCATAPPTAAPCVNSGLSVSGGAKTSVVEWFACGGVCEEVIESWTMSSSPASLLSQKDPTPHVRPQSDSSRAFVVQYHLLARGKQNPRFRSSRVEKLSPRSSLTDGGRPIYAEILPNNAHARSQRSYMIFFLTWGPSGLGPNDAL
ncbi:hypothetical protein BDK51DRAFT_48671 [Blyttiomyces helicus]|uniref:Uncharacterized protein n=1 Tax=Blyttiomyces helicus TaxID=388810 RepID=A0A4P9WCP1_9FUNG|nr:hypothetical protein BDK51DRAFT_48671 [Blyttiomyces helicus]|eukprot:RKO88670.1 hypothetical protein BDK51DRAFT_48671 [Blyttiomyces helicus]